MLDGICAQETAAEKETNSKTANPIFTRVEIIAHPYAVNLKSGLA
jgi:hypothetical protein